MAAGVKVLGLLLVGAALGNASVIRQSASIALVRILSATPEPWEASNSYERSRRLTIEVLAVRVLRGGLQAGSRGTIRAVQRESVGLTHAVAGSWSGKAVERDREYLVFSRSASTDPDEVFADDATLLVAEPNAAVDVETALEFEDHRWPLRDLNAHAGPAARQLGPMFASYLGERFPDSVKHGIREWDGILSFIERRDLNPAFRVPAAEAAFDAVLLFSPAPRDIVRRTVFMAFNLLASADDPASQASLLDTYLPNLLGMEGQEVKRTATQVFANKATERRMAEKALAQSPPSAGRERLLRWLRRDE